MLRHILWFEVRYWLRGWMLWIFLLIVAALILTARSEAGPLGHQEPRSRTAEGQVG